MQNGGIMFRRPAAHEYTQEEAKSFYNKIVFDKWTGFTDSQAEAAILFCIQGYREFDGQRYSDNAIVSAISVQDWSGMIRNMLSALRDRGRLDDLPKTIGIDWSGFTGRRSIPIMTDDTEQLQLGFAEGLPDEHTKA